MSAMLSQRLSLILGAVAGMVVVWLLLVRHGSIEGAQDPEKKFDLAKAEFWGVSSCMECHTEPRKTDDTELTFLTEHNIWRSKDRHALAYAVLAGPRGRQMGKLLGINVTDVVEGAACLNCHATTFRPDRRGQDFSLADGVSCDGCHGPAQHWITEHALKKKFWRSLTPEQKEARGMYNLRDPNRRAELCMSCHVGNAAEGKVVTHEMYAAGHPPLPAFEVAGFSSNLPKHWMDLKDTPFFKDKADPKLKKAYEFDSAEFQQTKLVLASSTVAVRAMMDLVVNRATLSATAPTVQGPRAWPPPWLVPHSKNEVKDRWPELPKKLDGDLAEALQSRWPEIAMAQTDCYACHHDLKSKSWRQIRGYQGKPGRPQLQPWPFALVDLTVTTAEEKELASRRKQLHAACDAQPFGTPEAVAKAAAGMAASSAIAGNSAKPLDRNTVSQLLKKLTVFNENDYPDYPSACQLAWASRMIYGDLVPAKSQPKEVKDILNAIDDELGLTIESSARKKFVAARYELTKKLIVANNANEIEKILKDQTFLNSLQAISNQELAAVLERMAQYDPVQFKQKMQQLGKLAP